MIVTPRWKRLPFVAGALMVLVLAAPAAAAPAPVGTGHSLSPDTRFSVRHPDDAALAQIDALRAAGQKTDANRLSQMLNTPQANWITGGTPAGAQAKASNVVMNARAKGTVPVIVLYNIPYRDCAQYSAGGASTTAQYEAWIDGVAAGIGNQRAVVLLEPDSIGIIPWYRQFQGLPSEAGSYEWCQPKLSDGVTPDPNATPANRFAQLNYAVDALEARPNTSVYLDGTHSNWLGTGDLSHRLSQAGVARAQGFFLNVSNFEVDSHLKKYGTWAAECIWFATDPGSWGKGHFDWCASQYYPASPGDFSTWTLTDQWYAANVQSQTWVPFPGVANLPTHFVIDSSRNGQGPWTDSGNHPAGDPQTWCNPPDRGLGSTPSANTGVALLDAFVWAKTPGESDGGCYRWTSGPQDPLRQMIDPAAGGWFPQMALELVQNAVPALPTDRPNPAW